MTECPNMARRKKLKGIPAKQKYKVEYSHKWPILHKSKISGNHVYCQTCRADINIGHSGLVCTIVEDPLNQRCTYRPLSKHLLRSILSFQKILNLPHSMLRCCSHNFL